MNTDEIRKVMMAMRIRDAWQTKCMDYVSRAGALFEAVAKVKYKGDKHTELRQLVAIQSIGVRLINTTGSADELLTRGYYQPAITMIRDLMECSFLLDLFSRRPEQLQAWMDLGLKAGDKVFSPYAVRMQLEELDGPRADVRRNQYKFYCGYGAHVNAAGVTYVAIGNAIQIGPFPDQQRLIGLTHDLTLLSVMASMHMCVWLANSQFDIVEGPEFDQLSNAMIVTRSDFFSVAEHLKEIRGAAERDRITKDMEE